MFHQLPAGLHQPSLQAGLRPVLDPLRQLGVLAPRIGQVLFDEFTESRTFLQLTYQDQAAIGGGTRSLEIRLE